MELTNFKDEYNSNLEESFMKILFRGLNAEDYTEAE